MKNIAMIRACGAVAAISLLILPLAGCGPFSFSGLDLLTNKEAGLLYKVGILLAVGAGVGVALMKEKSRTFLFSVAGLVVLLGLYGYSKIKLKSMGGSDDVSSRMSDAVGSAIEIKFGSYLAVVSFLAGAVISKLQNEIMPGNEPVVTTPPAPTPPVEQPTKDHTTENPS